MTKKLTTFIRSRWYTKVIASAIILAAGTAALYGCAIWAEGYFNISRPIAFVVVFVAFCAGVIMNDRFRRT